MSQDLRKGYWIERNEKGEPLYCHWYRKNGKKEVVKKTLEEIKKEMKEAN